MYRLFRHDRGVKEHVVRELGCVKNSDDVQKWNVGAKLVPLRSLVQIICEVESY